MGKTTMAVIMIVCSLLMGGTLLAFDLLFPGSVITWFAASGQQYLPLRSGILALLAVLLAVHWLYNNSLVRRACGLISLALLFGAYHMLMDYSVFIFDVLLLVHASVCFAIVAIQGQDELERLPSPPVPASVPVSVLSRTKSLVRDRIKEARRLQRRSRRFTPMLYMTEVKDDAHRLIIDYPRSLQSR